MPQGTGQLKKLIFTKEISDQYGVRWRLSTWKVAGWLIAVLLLLVILYSFFVPNQKGYLTDTLFYAIIIVAVAIVVWFAGNFVWKARGFFAWFLISWVLIFIFYIVMGFALSFIGWKFYLGPITWIFISTFALFAAGLKNKKDDTIDKVDVFFAFIVFIVLVGGNAPVFGMGIGFFEKVGDFIGIITNALGNFIHPDDLVPK